MAKQLRSFAGTTKASFASTLVPILAGALLAPDMATAPAVDATGVFARRGASWTSVAGSLRAEVNPVGRIRIETVDGIGDLELETQSLGRNEPRACPATPVSSGAERGDGALAWRRCDAVEMLRRSAQGFEQAWEFPDAPRGTGDLRVRVGVGHALAGRSDARGIAFRSESGAGRLRYGTPSWIDASGRRTRLAMRMSGDAIEITVPERVLERSSYPAVLDPVIGAEAESDAPVVAASLGYISDFDMAQGSQNLLAVWKDPRENLRPEVLSGETIWAARVSNDGAVLDPTSFRVSPLSARNPAVAFGDNQWMTVFICKPQNFGANICAVRVSIDGKVVDTTPVTVTSGNDTIGTPEIAFDGQNYLVAWQDRDSSTSQERIYATRLDGNAAVLDTPWMISPNSGNATMPDVAFAGGNYLVVWTDGQQYNVTGQRVGTDGKAIGAGFDTGLGAETQHPAIVAGGGNGFLVVAADNGVVARWLGANGTLGPSLLDLSSNGTRGVVSFDGTGFVVGWTDDSGAQNKQSVARVNADGSLGSPVAAHLPSVPEGAYLTGLFSESQGYIAAHTMQVTQDSSYETDLMVRTITSDLKSAGAATPLSGSGNGQQFPSVAHGTDQYLAIWEDKRNNELDLYAIRIDEAGKAVDAAPFAVSTRRERQRNPSVAFDGKQYLVAWTEYDGLYAARVGLDGTVLDPSGITVLQTDYVNNVGEYPSLAGNASGFVCVVRVQQLSGEFVDAISISSAGVPGSPIEVKSAPFVGAHPAIATNGKNFLAAWYEHAPYSVHSRLLGADGAVVGSDVVTMGETDGSDQIGVASDGSGFLVTAWLGSGGLEGRLLNEQGKALGEVLISAPLGSGASWDQVSVAFDGKAYVAAWSEGAVDPDKYVAAGWLTSSGQVLGGGTALRLSASGIKAGVPAIATDGKGGILAAYDRWVEDDAYHTVRVRTELVTDDYTIPPATGGAGGAAGAAGQAGASPAGGSAGSAGTAGSGQGGKGGGGGTPATGGMAGSGLGGSAQGGNPAEPANPSSDGGCGCRTSDRSTRDFGLLLAAIGGLSMIARRRRTAR